MDILNDAFDFVGYLEKHEAVRTENAKIQGLRLVLKGCEGKTILYVQTVRDGEFRIFFTDNSQVVVGDEMRLIANRR